MPVLYVLDVLYDGLDAVVFFRGNNMAIQRNDFNSFVVEREQGHFRSACSSTTAIGYKLYSIKEAYIDTDYMPRQLFGLSKLFIPYRRRIIERYDKTLPGPRVSSLWSCFG